MINFNDDLKPHYIISYLKGNELTVENHKLSYATKLIKSRSELISYGLKEQNMYITTRATSMLNYSEVLQLTRGAIKKLLLGMGDIT